MTTSPSQSFRDGDVLHMELFIEQFLNGLGAGAMYALITLGLALIYGVMKILHVAHASVYTAGAYMGLYIFLSTGSVLIAVIVSMAFCSVLGVLIERYIYYPLLKYPPYVPLISSIALLIAIEEFCRLVAGPEVRTFPAALPFPSAVVCGVTISSTLMAVYCLTVIILIALWLLMTKTELGLAMRAVAQDMETAAVALSGGVRGDAWEAWARFPERCSPRCCSALARPSSSATRIFLCRATRWHSSQ